ncbi:MAG: hypothetical protein OEW09_17985, partial [Anaerolineae bacterium]|nr:hypothetical protein [Anaerolineae bacterium]
MIHTMITAINTNLPMPHILLGAISGLLIAASIFLWLKRGSRSGATMLLALAIGLGALTWGVLEGQKPASLDWGSLESLGETLIGPFEYRFREQIVEGVLVAAVVLLYVSWSRTGREVVIAVPAGTRTRWANTWAQSCACL